MTVCGLCVCVPAALVKGRLHDGYKRESIGCINAPKGRGERGGMEWAHTQKVTFSAVFSNQILRAVYHFPPKETSVSRENVWANCTRWAQNILSWAMGKQLSKTQEPSRLGQIWDNLSIEDSYWTGWNMKHTHNSFPSLGMTLVDIEPHRLGLCSPITCKFCPINTVLSCPHTFSSLWSS